MAGSPALVLLLALGLCCPRIWCQNYKMTVRFRDSKITQPQAGQQLELECVSSKEDSGAFWVRLDKGGTLHFIVFISSLGRVNFEGNEKTSTRFKATKHQNIYRLAVNSFTPQDEGNYFCLVNNNQKLYFSPGQPAFLPVTTTEAPITLPPTTQPGVTKKDLKTLDPENSKEKEVNFFCNIFIWVPLAGACLLLFIALAVTIMLCQQTRRRRCRCKRPVNGKPNEKPYMPSPRL